MQENQTSNIAPIDPQVYAESLGADTRKKYRMFAYASTWFGCFTDVVMDNSAIIILYLAMLGGSESMIMLSTSLVGMVSMFLLIPTARIVDKLGAKRVINISCYIALTSYLMMASGAFFGGMGKYVAFTGCFIFCISKPLWMGAWMPLLSNILLPKERGDFFGFMRFSYYILSASILSLVGFAMGEKPPAWVLQTVIAMTGILVIGRIIFISKIKIPDHVEVKRNIRKSVKEALSNSSLVGFCIYICFISFAYMTVLPLPMLYLKKGLHCGDNIVQIISSVGIFGYVLGFFVYGKLVRQIGIRNMQFMIHTLFILIPLSFFFCGEKTPYVAEIAGVLLFFGNFAFACFYCAFSQETLSLAKPGNVPMSTALCQTYQMMGMGFSRVASSFLLLGGILSTSWNYGGFTFNNYQTIFLICASLGFFGLALVILLPSVIRNRDNYYNP